MKNNSDNLKTTLKDDIWLMGLALEEAEKAYRKGEVPVGAVLVNNQRKILASSHNLKEEKKNPLLHAELISIEKACEEMGDWRLNGCSLYVTLEPCLMCMGAIWQSRISRLVFGAYDPKGGALSLGYDPHNDSRLNHQFQVMGGVEHYRSSQLLSQFFKERRGSYRGNS